MGAVELRKGVSAATSIGFSALLLLATPLLLVLPKILKTTSISIQQPFSVLLLLAAPLLLFLFAKILNPATILFGRLSCSSLVLNVQLL